jgi:cytochrome P450
MPSGMLIFEDPPLHDIHRKLLARMFTPRKIDELEDKTRKFCARSLDPIVGTGRFDFVKDLGADADEGDRHVARHPGGGPGDHPGPLR